ncbi:hypothetical protein BKA62DRAFT_196741 [Auriculariales sp. MPI-PUGE-AT-0066]|nr:hypothetical protein BKA62DRAFT_196741 [Auriculariales sp. MPI-PUGE-AT-0066]
MKSWISLLAFVVAATAVPIDTVSAPFPRGTPPSGIPFPLGRRLRAQCRFIPSSTNLPPPPPSGSLSLPFPSGTDLPPPPPSGSASPSFPHPNITPPANLLAAVMAVPAHRTRR